MKRTIAVSIALLAVTVSWSVSLMISGPWSPDSAAMLAASLLAITALAITGMTVSSSRWGLRLASGVAVLGPVLGVAVPVTPWWVVNLIVSGLVVAGLAGTATSGAIRKLPAADGPTSRVVVFSLALAAIPLFVALVSPDGLGPAEWIMIVVAVVASVLYSKAAPLALMTVRTVVPLGSVIAALISGVPRGLIWVAIGIAEAALAWHKEIRLGIRPLAEPGRAVPMLPEMVPAEILEAAGLDERGRPKERP